MATPATTTPPPAAETTPPAPPATEPQSPPPAAPPAETPPAPPAAPTDPRLNPSSPMYDPAWKAMIDGLSMAVGEKPPATQDAAPTIGRTLAESAIFAEERRASEQPAAPAATDPAAAATPPVAPAPPEKPPVEVEKRKPLDQVVKDAVAEVLKDKLPAQPAASPTAAAPAAPPADPFESQLTEGERDELDFARYAAQKDPALKDLPAQTLAYFKKVADYVTKAQAESSDRTFDETDQDFVQFTRKNRPALSPVQRKRIEHDRIADVAVARVTQQKDKEIAEIRQRQHVLETQPRVERAVQAYTSETENYLAADEQSPIAPVVKRAKEVGWDRAVEEDPMFAPIVRHYHENSVGLAAAYESIIAGVTTFSDKNPQHKWLHQFVVNSADRFAQTGGDAKLRDGKTFLTPAEYNDIAKNDPQRASRYWTWNDRDVLGLLAQNTKMNIEAEVKKLNDRLNKAGFARQLPNKATPSATTAAPTPPAATSPAAPRFTPSAAPGAGQGSAPPKPASAFEPEYLKALNLPVLSR